jgi:hypothetical protein
MNRFAFISFAGRVGGDRGGTQRATILSAILMVVCCIPIGCDRSKSEPTPSTPPATSPAEDSAASSAEDSAASPAEDSAGTRDASQRVAAQAKDALFAALSSRLMEVLQSQGPAAAIEVCSQEAVEIAQQVGQEHGVEIGRTSFKLRNPANAPRDWVQPYVEQRIESPQSLTLENGNHGALFPIRLDVKCLICHGGPDDMLEQVSEELAKRYPNDQATGFKQGDLRGWFWVEVPK